ncbi:sugar phosphate isomerase/epimerase [Sphingobium sp.]|uniref:sugar phosphate isomerase/epimerase family protein n=1 Tax=Sphingobium sp. TaxID=1912891 RepID=UPI0028BEF78E|nr:sugar phosphate isomerase/epimerase [Sphingobium sp.]
MECSRRDTVKLLVASTAAFVGGTGMAASLKHNRPNSKWAGVQVGLNVPYSFGTRTAMSAEEVLRRTVELGISAVELRLQPIEISMGLPRELVLGPAPSDYSAVYYPLGDAPAVIPPAPGRTVLTPADIATYQAGAAPRREWRVRQSMHAAQALRRKYAAAGVKIDIVKIDGISDLEGDELDYAFRLAKTLGARAISGEMLVPAVPRLAAAANRHRFMVALHNHLPITPALWEDAFQYSPYIGANVDLGHFVAGNRTSPIAFIEKHHRRIPHIHVKDKTLDNINVEFGTGDTPIKDVLRLLRDKNWPITAVIEYELKLPVTADRTAEVRKAIEFCHNCLIS